MSGFYGEIAFGKACPDFRIEKNCRKADQTERIISFENSYVYVSLSSDRPRQEVCDGIYFHENNDILLICTGYIYNCGFMKEKAGGLRSLPASRLGDAFLSLYLREGMEWVKDINGQFSFLICDLKKREAYFAVDRTGIYNLYYAYADGNLVFSTDMKYLMQHPKVEKKLNFKALQQMLLFCSIASPATIVKGVKSVSGGTYVKASETAGEEFVYWDFYLPEKGTPLEKVLTEGEYIERFEDIFTEAIKNEMDLDGFSGVFLSGGLDSSIVAAHLHRLKPETELYTFSLDYKFAGLSESIYQKMMVDELNSRHLVKDFGLPEFSLMLSEAVKGAEGPFCELGTCAYYLLYQLANSRECDLFSGLGADELFAGYITYKADRFRRIGDEKSQTDKKINYLLWGDENFSYESPSYAAEMVWIKEAFTETAVNEILRNNSLSEAIFNRRAVERDLDVLHRRSYIDYKLRLMNHKNFHIASKMSRKYGKRTHYPFLDNQMLDFACQLPSNLKLKGNTDKYIIRESAGKYVPAPILERKKISLGDFTYREVIGCLLENYEVYFTYDFMKAKNLVSYDFLMKLIGRLDEPKPALDRFREKNIILTYLTLCVFNDSYNIQIY